MRIIALLSFLASLLVLIGTRFGAAPLIGFGLWMGGFLTSEIVSWFLKTQIPLKENGHANR